MSRGSTRGSSSPTSPMMCDRVPRHIAQHVARLVIDYFAYVAHPGDSSRRMARCRLLRLRRASGCHDTSCGSSCGSSSTTSPMLCDRVPRHVARLVVDHAPSRRSTSRRSVALALAVRLVTASRGAATRCPDCTGSRICHASGRAVSPLDFSLIGRTGSRRASGHCVSRRNYSSSGLHRLYCAYVVHPDTPSHLSTSCQSVALALAVRPITAYRGATTRRPDYTGSTAPMSCIRTCRLTARLLVSRSHWL
jgi:hypothetical protein